MKTEKNYGPATEYAHLHDRLTREIKKIERWESIKWTILCSLTGSSLTIIVLKIIFG